MVTADVRPYSLVVGNPAREVRRRFDERTIEALLRIRWWEWPQEVVLARVAELNATTDVRGFVERYDLGTPVGLIRATGRRAKAHSSRLAAACARLAPDRLPAGKRRRPGNRQR